MINKRGMEHVEVILSFVIFIGFLIFLLVIFRPFEKADKSSVYLDTVERGIKDFANIQVNYTSLILNNSFIGCFYINYPCDKVIVKDKDDNIINAKCGEGKVYIGGSGKFYSIYSSEEFEENSFDVRGCQFLDESNYSFGLFRSYDMVLYERLLGLKEKYETDYTGIKKDFNLPASENFAFTIKDTTQNIMMQTNKTVPKRLTVLARDAPIQIIYKNGTIKYAILNVQNW